MRGRWSRSQLWDAGTAIALTVWLQSVVWSPSLQRSSGDVWGEQPQLDSVLLAPLTVALAFRSAAPAVAGYVGFAAVIAQAALSDVAPDAIAELTPMMVLLYSSARRCDRRGALGVAAAATVAIVLHSLNTTVTDGDIIGMFSGWVLLFIPWFVGRFVRARASREIELEEKAAALERERDALAQVAVAEERARIGRELHDVIAHGVSVMGLQAGAAEQVLDRDPEKARAPLAAIQDTARTTLGELRILLGALRDPTEPASRDPLPGLDRLPDLLASMEAAGLAIDVGVEGEPTRLSTGADVTAYRIVQEATTNALKHAGPGSRVTLRLAYGFDAVRIDVLDDAGGEPGPDAPGGHGLLGLRERVAVHGGRFAAGPVPEGGFRVTATIPLA